MASTELANLTALADVLKDLPIWITWTGLGTSAERLERIGMPELTDTASLPAMTLDFGAGRRVNTAATASSACFRPAGTIGVTVFALDVEADGTLAERWQAFGELFFQLIDEVIVAAHDTIFINGISYSDQPIRREAVNLFHAVDANSDDVDDTTEQPLWIGSFVVSWGGPPA